MLPDSLKALIGYLATHADLVPLHGGQVSTRLQTESRCVRVTSLGGPQPWPWETRPQYQIEWWGPRADEDPGPALDLCRAGEAALWQLSGAAITGGRVTGFSVPLSQLWSPAEDTGRPRFRTDVALTISP